jgi:HAD superfamily hydrolase (TIGR01509 family)
MRHIEAVVFDMDGVLVDAKMWHYEALNMALALFGSALAIEEHSSRFDGRPTRVKLNVLVEEGRLPGGLASFVAEMKQVYTQDVIRTRCRPEFAKQFLLSTLRRRGFRLAVASNSVAETVDLMMRKSGLFDYLDLILSNEDVSKPKPSPEIYELAAHRLGVAADGILVVEDHPVGIAAARAAGCTVLEVAGPEEVTLDRVTGAIACASRRVR